MNKQCKDMREWKLISQPGRIFAHAGPAFSEAEIWVVPKNALKTLKQN